MRLIDADEVIKAIDRHTFDTVEGLCLDEDITVILEELTTIQPKKGKWINNNHDLPICNQCGYMPKFDRAIDDYYYSNFCPNCGARMVNEDE